MDDSKNGGKAIASLILGGFGIVAWIIPFFGFPVTIVGLVLGIMGMKSNRRGIAIAGVVLSILFLILTVGNSAVGAYMGAMRALQQ